LTNSFWWLRTSTRLSLRRTQRVEIDTFSSAECPAHVSCNEVLPNPGRTRDLQPLRRRTAVRDSSNRGIFLERSALNRWDTDSDSGTAYGLSRLALGGIEDRASGTCAKRRVMWTPTCRSEGPRARRLVPIVRSLAASCSRPHVCRCSGSITNLTSAWPALMTPAR
jgi:hypothetical protein